MVDIRGSQYRIANWNLERPHAGTKKTKLALEKITEINADLIVLTETSSAINLEPAFYPVRTVEFKKFPAEQWVTIWSKWEVIKQIKTFDAYRTVCALIKSPFGEILVYGTIIPYHMAGVNGSRYENKGYHAWQMHEEDIIRQSFDWKQIMSDFPNTPFFLIGDFNQTRGYLSKGYGTDKCRDLLTAKLKENHLICVTEIDFTEQNQLREDPKTKNVRKNIDHICISESLLNSFSKYEIGAWNHFNEDGFHISDHNGVCIDFAI